MLALHTDSLHSIEIALSEALFPSQSSPWAELPERLSVRTGKMLGLQSNREAVTGKVADTPETVKI